MEKLSRETKVKTFSSGARRHGMVRLCVEITVVVNNWEMGWGAMSIVWISWGVDFAHGIYAPFPLFCCSARKNLEYKWQLRVRMHGKVDYEGVESKWLKGGYLA